jgi:DNA-binding beta-propeller fold protein YncE
MGSISADSKTRRAFVACEQIARLVTVDPAHDRQTSTSSVGQDPDVLAFDPSLRILYVASESGTVSMFTTSAATLRKVGQRHLADAAHTIAVDPSTHHVYLPPRASEADPYSAS